MTHQHTCRNCGARLGRPVTSDYSGTRACMRRVCNTRHTIDHGEVVSWGDGWFPGAGANMATVGARARYPQPDYPEPTLAD